MSKCLPALLMLLLLSCNRRTGLFGVKNAHEQYFERLQEAGLVETALVKAWRQAANNALTSPHPVILPHKETGFFDPADPRAVGLAFQAREGERIFVNVSLNADSTFLFFTDLWIVNDTTRPRLIESSEHQTSFTHTIEKQGRYLVRIQPELLRAVQYTLTIGTGPSMAFPVPNGQIKSFWGADRDGGQRRHEGIDIFAPRGTPVLAVEEGRIARVQENRLGGKVIFQRTGNYSIYYAHLDSQIAIPGDQVRTGDTVGFVGNTGNASTTSPHLHLGVYTFGGAIDPLPFVDPTLREVPKINANIKVINQPGRFKGKVRHDGSDEYLKPIAAYRNFYRAQMADGTLREIKDSEYSRLIPLQTLDVADSTPLMPYPGSKIILRLLYNEQKPALLAKFGDFQFVRIGELEGWIEKGL